MTKKQKTEEINMEDMIGSPEEPADEVVPWENDAEDLLYKPEIQKYIAEQIEAGIKKRAVHNMLQGASIATLQQKEESLLAQMQDNARAFEKLVPIPRYIKAPNEFGQPVMVVDMTMLPEEAIKLDQKNDRLRRELEAVYYTKVYVALRHLPESLRQNEEGITFSYNGRAGALLFQGAETWGSTLKDNTQVITYGELKECLLRAAQIRWSKYADKRGRSGGYKHEPRVELPGIEVLGVVPND